MDLVVLDTETTGLEVSEGPQAHSCGDARTLSVESVRPLRARRVAGLARVRWEAEAAVEVGGCFSRRKPSLRRSWGNA